MGLRNRILKINPYNQYLLRKKRESLKDIVPFTIMASNCLGGLLYHTYGLRFTSPLINTRMSSKEFVKFILNYKEYLKEKLYFIDSAEPFPVARLGDVIINFVHYKTNEEAECKWEQRKKRIIDDRLFVLLNDCDGVTKEDIRLIDESFFENVVLFTSKQLPDSRSSFYLPPFKNQPSVGNTMQKSILTGEMMVEHFFDFTAWFKQDRGSVIERYRLL